MVRPALCRGVMPRGNANQFGLRGGGVAKLMRPPRGQMGFRRPLGSSERMPPPLLPPEEFPLIRRGMPPRRGRGRPVPLFPEPEAFLPPHFLRPPHPPNVPPPLLPPRGPHIPPHARLSRGRGMPSWGMPVGRDNGMIHEEPFDMPPPPPPPLMGIRGRGMMLPPPPSSFLTRGRLPAPGLIRGIPPLMPRPFFMHRPGVEKAVENKPKKESHSWITPVMKEEIKKKHSLYAKYKRTSNPADHAAFKEQRNKVSTMLREAKLEYIGTHPDDEVSKMLIDVAASRNIRRLAKQEEIDEAKTSDQHRTEQGGNTESKQLTGDDSKEANDDTAVAPEGELESEAAGVLENDFEAVSQNLHDVEAIDANEAEQADRNDDSDLQVEEYQHEEKN